MVRRNLRAAARLRGAGSRSRHVTVWRGAARDGRGVKCPLRRCELLQLRHHLVRAHAIQRTRFADGSGAFAQCLAVFAQDQPGAFQPGGSGLAVFQLGTGRCLGEFAQRVGIAMESLYAEHLEDHFGELAHHFSRTDDVAKGLEYQRKAGDQAHRMYAYSTAVAHFTKALELTSRMPWSNSRDQQELTLRLSLGTTLIAITSIGSPIVHENFSRARELCRSQRESPEVLHTLFGLCWFYIGRGELDTARELGKEMLELVENSPDRLPWLLTDSAFGPALVWSGNFAYARIRLEHGYAFYDPNRPDQTIITDFGVICLSYLAFTLWSLGFPDQASTCRDRSGTDRGLRERHR